ncbi:MAG: gamma-glutamyltransferase [Candidatus Dadabacteria bacterium]|nr:MAG: gamma-glutamyltransferase [Candidatus Dadabacteria bacterium]
MTQRLFIYVLFAALAACNPVHHAALATPARGAVASTHELATQVGVSVLARGGNAVDAAVATALVLAVVHPQAGNLGGGGFAVVRVDGRTSSLDFRETAPAAATPDMFTQAGLPERASLVGGLAVGVPGAPAGYFELHRRYGALPWRDVVTPAIELARRGIPVTVRLARDLWRRRTLLSTFPATKRTWFPDGRLPVTGSVIAVPALADALAAYQARGPAAITTGTRAEAIARAARDAGGVLTVTDLAEYRAVWRSPVQFDAFGWRIAAMGLPSSGGILMAETFGLIERRGWPQQAPVDRLHLLIESWRRAYADRYLLADPQYTGVSPDVLLDPARLDRLARTIDLQHATPSAQVHPYGHDISETTHLSVVDAAGNAVAMTVTLNGSFGSGVFVPEVGILLNNEMDDFATRPGAPNLYGLVQGNANAPRPGARMLSSMTPTIAVRGEDVIAIGSPGGSRIPTATMQVLLGMVVEQLSARAAVRRPRIHHQWLPDRVYAEPGALDGDLQAALVARGHTIVDAGWPIGEVHVAARLGRQWLAAADPRQPGTSARLVGVKP